MYIIEKKQICYNGGKYSKKHTKIKESHMEKRTLYREGTYKKGNLHTHTTWSDGMHTPKEPAEHYRSWISSCREEKITIWWVLVCRRRTGFRNIIPLRKSAKTEC